MKLLKIFALATFLSCLPLSALADSIFTNAGGVISAFGGGLKTVGLSPDVGHWIGLVQRFLPLRICGSHHGSTCNGCTVVQCHFWSWYF